MMKLSANFFTPKPVTPAPPTRARLRVNNAAGKTSTPPPPTLPAPAPDPTDEAAVRALFHRLRWPQRPLCPRCGGDRVSGHNPAPAPPPTRLFCNDCGRNFSVLLGTILENSHLPLRVWLGAFQSLATGLPTTSELRRRQPELTRPTALRLRRCLAPFAELARCVAAQDPNANPTLRLLQLALDQPPTQPALRPAPPPATPVEFAATSYATLHRLMGDIATDANPASAQRRAVLFARLARGFRDVRR